MNRDFIKKVNYKNLRRSNSRQRKNGGRAIINFDEREDLSIFENEEPVKLDDLKPAASKSMLLGR